MSMYELDVNSPAMEEAVASLDKMLKKCLDQVFDGEFESGEINLKLEVGVEPAIELFPATDDLGEPTEHAYEYKKPVLKHKASLQLKKKEEISGQFCGRVELKMIDGQFVAVPIEDAQMSLFENESVGEAVQ